MAEPLRRDITRILVIQIRAIGDVVLTTPVLPVLKRHFPEARIDFLTGKGIGSILRGLPEVHEVLEITPYAGIAEVWEMIREVRSRNYDLVIDYQGTNTPALIAYFSRAPYRLGWQRVRRRWAYTIYGQPESEMVYVPLQKCQLLRAIGITEENWHPQIAFSLPAHQKAAEFLKSHHSGNGPVINVTVVGKRQARQWFPDRWARTIDLLQEELNATVFVNATPKELPDVENVTALCRKTPYILPMWNLETFAAYLAQVDLHLSYDNGVKHLAVALDVPTISFYGSARPEHWHPPGQPLHRAIYPDVPCRGCGRIFCGSMVCMETITPETVVQLAKEQLRLKKVVGS